MKRDLLKILADKLRTVPPAEFDIHQWECGTVACAGGWACRIPELQLEGLHMGANGLPWYLDSFGLTAMQRLFDLRIGQVKLIFLPDGYDNDPSPTEVADKIERMCAE